MLALENDAEGIRFSVRVQPNARRTAVVGVFGEGVKIALQAPAVEGKANEALIGFLSDLAGVRRTAVSILKGEKSRNKRVRIVGVTQEELRERLKAEC